MTNQETLKTTQESEPIQDDVLFWATHTLSQYRETNIIRSNQVDAMERQLYRTGEGE